MLQLLQFAHFCIFPSSRMCFKWLLNQPVHCIHYKLFAAELRVEMSGYEFHCDQSRTDVSPGRLHGHRTLRNSQKELRLMDVTRRSREHLTIGVLPKAVHDPLLHTLSFQGAPSEVCTCVCAPLFTHSF